MISHRQALLASLVLAAACGGSNGVLTLKLTDSAGGFKAAVVTITQINLQSTSGVTAVSNTKVTTNLVTLSNDVSTLVTNANVKPDTYTEMDFVISGAYVEVPQAGGGSIIYSTSATYEGLPAGAQVGGTLAMPSGGAVKVTLPGNSLTVGTDAKTLLVDFDVGQSFSLATGSSSAWTMHPVMTATDFALAGSLNVTLKLDTGVTLPGSLTLGSFDVVLTNSGQSSKTLQLQAGSGGVFAATFKYLIPGNFTVGFALDSSVSATLSVITTKPSIPLAVTVSSGAATESDFMLESAN